jgi:HD-like signal output (HDOD) protein
MIQVTKTKTIKIPIILEADLRAIAKCLDQDPSIGNKIIEYAQSLIEP